MIADGVCAEEVPRWVPGEVLLASDGLKWSGVKLRAYRYTPLDVEVPRLQDFVLVAYRRGPTAMARRFDGRWRRADLIPGDISLLTRAQWSHWHWDGAIDVIHVYLTASLMAQVCAELYDRPIVDVHLHDVLKIRDAVLFNGALAIAAEVAQAQFGGELYVDAVARQMCVHALRHYTSVSFRDVVPMGGLSRRQQQCLVEFIAANLAGSLTVERLATVAGVSGCFLLRHFKARFGSAPHAYVLACRLERARTLLTASDYDVATVASLCGFADQPHLTRAFKRAHGTTPAAYRRARRR